MSSEHLILNEALQRYLGDLAEAAPDPLLGALRDETIERCGDRSVMQISRPQGALLSVLVGLTGARSVIEVGTFTGYSSLCMARALPAGGRLLCCDVSEEWTAVARRYWAMAGVTDRIDLRLGPAQETIAALAPGAPFDLAFIDADKSGYDHYFEALLPRMRSGALFVFDNMLWSGRVVSPSDVDTRAIDALNRKLARDPRVESVLLPFADGLHLARVR